MDGAGFDRFVRGIGGSLSRRRILATLSAGLAGRIAGVGTGAAAAQECAPGLIACRGICADPLTNPIFCGSCDNECMTGACSGGVCVTCEEIGQDSCSGGAGRAYCTDLLTDPFNCGACANGSSANFCTSGLCVDGACVSTVECAPGLTECNGQCYDLMTDVSHCGSCWGECYGGESQPGVCIEGQCVQCESLGLTWCNSQISGSYDPYCADLTSDPLNCGECGRACESGKCVNGACEESDEADPTEPAGGGQRALLNALDLLLASERFSLELLRYGLNTFPNADWNDLGPGVRSNLSKLRVHEKEHVALVQDAILEAGGQLPLGRALDFPSLEAPVDVLVTLETFKRLMTGAYVTAMASLDNASRSSELAGVLAGVLAVEGSHAGYLAALREVTPFEQSRTAPVAPEAIEAFIVPFVAAS